MLYIERVNCTSHKRSVDYLQHIKNLSKHGKMTLASGSLETLRYIWSSLINLTELNICISEDQLPGNASEFVLDSVFTVIPEDVCLELKRNKAFEGLSLKDVNVHPSIINSATSCDSRCIK